MVFLVWRSTGSLFRKLSFIVHVLRLYCIQMRIRRPPPAPVEMLHKDPYICWFELLGGFGGVFLLMRKMRQIGLVPKCH